MKKDYNKWHQWFAWFPVRLVVGKHLGLEEKFFWFTKVWRIAHPASYDGEGGWCWWYLPPTVDIEAIKKQSQEEGKELYMYGGPDTFPRPLID